MVMVNLQPGEEIVRMRTFELHWGTTSNPIEIVKGYDIADAFTKAGYSAGAIRALDSYKEITDQPTT